MSAWRYRAARIASALWLGVITWGSLAPQESVRGAFTFGDVLVHVVGYLGLTLLLVASQRTPRYFVTLGVSVGIGIVMELLQMLTSDRSGSLLDVVANAAGAVIGVVAWRIGARLTS